VKTRTHAAFAALILLVGTAALVADQGHNGGQNSEARLKTRLAGAAIQGQTPEGNADFRSDQNGRVRLNVEVEHVNLPAGTVLTVSVQDGATVTVAGTITLSATGERELELNSQDGATVPAVQKGDMITVSNAGKTILAGAF
jgi:hypothetical protein